MSGTRMNIFEIQLQDLHTGTTIATAGGRVYVATANDASKAVLYNADTGLALANPVTPSNGYIRFATLATVETVDIYGMAGGGQSFVRKGVQPGGTTEIFIEGSRADQCQVVPFAAADVTAATEIDTGFDLPQNALVLPDVSIIVSTVDATETIDVGLLSSESGGDADGFIVAASVATAGRIRGALVGTDTLGALLKEDTNGSTVLVPATYPVGATARSVTFTLSTGTDTAEGFICIHYQRALN